MIIIVHNYTDNKRVAFDSKRLVSIVEGIPDDDNQPSSYIVIDQGFKGLIKESFDDVLDMIKK